MRSALILAGGASRRFGRPKAFVEFRGRPMIGWVAAAISAQADELLVAVADDEQEARVADLLPASRIVVDALGGRGPIEGLARGLQAARGEFLLVAPCDAPLIRAELYGLLLTAVDRHEAAVPRLESMDPVRAVYRREAAVRALRTEGDRIESPSALVDRLDTVFLGEGELRTADPHLVSFLDVNVQDDLERAAATEG